MSIVGIASTEVQIPVLVDAVLTTGTHHKRVVDERDIAQIALVNTEVAELNTRREEQFVGNLNLNTGKQLECVTLNHGCKLIDLIIRPQITIESIAEYIPAFKALLDKITDRKEEIIEAAEVLIKYQGYIDRERMIADKIHRLEAIRIKGRFDYNSLNSLSTEARQKLIKIDPETLAQASRIPGISPSDINVLLVLLGR